MHTEYLRALYANAKVNPRRHKIIMTTIDFILPAVHGCVYILRGALIRASVLAVEAVGMILIIITLENSNFLHHIPRNNGCNSNWLYVIGKFSLECAKVSWPQVAYTGSKDSCYC